MNTKHNPLGLMGIEFTEFSSKNAQYMHDIFIDFGFSKLKKMKNKNVVLYKQHNIHFLLNLEDQGFAANFSRKHGPAICSMGWRVADAYFAYETAIKRGAKPVTDDKKDLPYPAIYGIGGSLIYFIDKFGEKDNIYKQDFIELDEPILVESKGLTDIDHLTNNVFKGTMEKWANFYKDIFGFTEIRYFDINGVKSSLISYALRSPDGSFCIPINEGKGNNNNQIDEYLHEYHGPGVQHIAFKSSNIIQSLEALKNTHISTLDIIPKYYDTIFDKFPLVTEDKNKLKQHQILIDGDESGYLLQIFTRNLFGPIFIEIIQRKNNQGFGEGNFTALFESIERDQIKRGVL